MDATLIVIPARNEAATIQDVIRKIKSLGPYPIVVVNDGSTDATAPLAAEAGATVFSLPLPLGAWGAMQTGLYYAWCQGYQKVVTMDADGQHNPEDIKALTEPLTSNQFDVAIGACPERGSWARHLAWAFYRRLTGFSIEDLTSGFRVYNQQAIALLAGSEATLLDYQDIGVLMLLKRSGLRIVEVPIRMSPRQYGKSKIFSSWFTVTRYMAETTLLCLARWRTQHK